MFQGPTPRLFNYLQGLVLKYRCTGAKKGFHFLIAVGEDLRSKTTASVGLYLKNTGLGLRKGKTFTDVWNRLPEYWTILSTLAGNPNCSVCKSAGIDYQSRALAVQSKYSSVNITHVLSCCAINVNKKCSLKLSHPEFLQNVTPGIFTPTN